jgi:hypothetical protein
MHNKSIKAIDNIFIDKVKYENYSIHPLVNGLSDHNAQIITVPPHLRKFSVLSKRK